MPGMTDAPNARNARTKIVGSMLLAVGAVGLLYAVIMLIQGISSGADLSLDGFWLVYAILAVGLLLVVGGAVLHRRR